MGIEAFGIGPASRFATEHPSLQLKCKPRVKSPASAGLFFTFPAAKQALDSNPASFDPLVGTRQPMRLARAARARVSSDTRPPSAPATAFSSFRSISSRGGTSIRSIRSGRPRSAPSTSRIRMRRPTTASTCRAFCASTPASMRRSTRPGRCSSISKTSSTRAIGPRPTATTTSRRVNRGPSASRSPRSCKARASVYSANSADYVALLKESN